MAVTLPGYEITETIYESDKTIIKRGIRETDKTSVIIKSYKSEYPTLEEITRIKHEYNIIQSLNIPGVVKPYELKKYQHSFALILEDFSSLTLKEFITNQTSTLIDFLTIAINLAQALGELHFQNIIHKDIKPHNILINPQTRQIKLVGFSVSSRLDKENPTISNPNWLEGTLTYMSPEQTGRMNRCLDYRTDFYSLGISLYELLTGTVPCNSSDLMELVHCHIAKTPTPPCQDLVCRISTQVPKAVSAIVMKLLSKTAEERYQSAFGLKADLEECLRQIQTQGKIVNFIPGEFDNFGQFHIHQKLYGRAKEVTEILATFERVIAGDRAEIMLVSGYSGIGKTSVVNEVHKPIVATKGYFIAGKYDQFKRNIPFAALLQAFQELIQQLLTETEAKVQVWKEKLLSVLSTNGQVIIDVIPEVELIIGKQPPVPQLGAVESQNRLSQVFKQFISVFTTIEHPLVIFLDDLQWADSASLSLIKLLIAESDRQYLLLIGAYRDNEVSPTHPLIQTLEKIISQGVPVNNIILNPLKISDIEALVSDSLKVTSLETKKLAALLLQKTGGNPFFLTQLLKTLYQEKQLVYNFFSRTWQWNLEKIQAVGITDYDIVELIVRNIHKLPEDTQEVLKLAACIGNTFNLEVLAIVNQESSLVTGSQLWSALQAGLILPLSHDYKIPLLFDASESSSIVLSNVKVDYKFLHDRVQQAAYSLIPEDCKRQTHLKIGQLLLKNTPIQDRKEHIFNLVNQLNYGAELLTSEQERYELAQLNLLAGQKAKAATAYEVAVNYLLIGTQLLAKSSWRDRYDLTLNLYIELTEAQYLHTNFDQANECAAIVLQHAANLLDKIKIIQIKMQMYLSQVRLQAAIKTGLQALELLEINIEEPLAPLPTIEELFLLPEMTDPAKIAALQILINLSTAAFFADLALIPKVIYTLINLSNKYGNASPSALAYIFYGMVLCCDASDIDSGYRFGQLGLKLLEKFNATELKCKIYNNFYAGIAQWKKPLSSTLENLQLGLQVGLETGELDYSGYCAYNYCAHNFFSGENLQIVTTKLEHHIELTKKFKHEWAVNSLNLLLQGVLKLQGYVENKCLLVEKPIDESELVFNFTQANNCLGLGLFYLIKTLVACIYRQTQDAVQSGSMADKYVANLTGMISYGEHYFYYSLALLAHYYEVEVNEQKQYLNLISSHQEKISKWADNAPENFQHKYQLLEAEKARVLGQNDKAMDYYERAIQGAKNSGYFQEEALALELAAEFHLSLGREKIAKTYITDAYYGYTRWGANAKVQDLERRYPHFLTRVPVNENLLESANIAALTRADSRTGLLDLTTVIKASQSLAGEIVLDKLLSSLMKILIENAGAQKGFLLLNQAEKLVIAARLSVDKKQAIVQEYTPVESSEDLPLTVIKYVERTSSDVVLSNAATEGIYTNDPYIAVHKLKSILCTPILNQGKLIAILYLENNLTLGAFTTDRLEVLRMLSSQAAISLENALLYASLEQKVQDRTQQLNEKNLHLEQTLHELKTTQSQLIQAEKMSGLGQMVAGVAHEINNPVNFIHGNLTYTQNYIKDLLELIKVYQQEYPHPTEKVQDKIEEIELDFLGADLQKLLSSMQQGTKRISNIVLSLRNFSRLDESDKKAVDINEGIESTLLILQHRFQDKKRRTEIEVIKEYGKLPLTNCYAAQLNQVFMNVLNNALDAIEQVENDQSSFTPWIRVSTEATDSNVKIRIADNGIGMNEEVQKNIFNPFYTTKPVGSGTGLGLSVGYQIVVEKHGGKITCISQPLKGAEFIIEIPIK